jgi:signal transduction histidine kinase
MADAERIHQVLYNLLDNAVRFTPPGGSVEVTGTIAGHRCVVTVTDTGTGIAPDRLPFVFERFYRADPARARGSRGTGGTGIGLAIVRSIVEAHGGHVRAESEPGRGSAFAFDLALAGPPTDRGGHAPDAVRGQAPGAPTTQPTTPGGPRPAVGASATRGGSQ